MISYVIKNKQKIWLFLVSLFLLLLFSCSDTNNDLMNYPKEDVTDKKVTSEEKASEITPVIENPINTESYGIVNIQSFLLKEDKATYSAFLIKDNSVHVVVPHSADLTNLTPFFSDNITVVSVDKYDFSDFVHPVEIKVVDEKEIAGICKVIIYDLPILIIETPEKQEITSKDIRVNDCVITLITENTTENLGTAGIKLRGNSTALQDKKPYNLKFDKKQSPLGMKKSKKWVLLANANYDRTQLHNATAFEIARLSDFPWVQDGRFVELILNGEHKGLYYFCEKIEIEKDRINIDELKETDIDDVKISGGYLLETDVYDPEQLGLSSTENYSFNTEYYTKTGLNGAYKCTLGYFLKSPDENVPSVQFEYIKNHFNLMVDAIKDFENNNTNNGGGYKQYIDVESLINWYLIEELCLNEESSRLKNMYLYKKRGDDKIYIGPPWDFDAWSFGLTGSRKNYLENSGWFWSVLFNDAEFVSRLKEKWNTYKPVWEQKIPNFIDEQYELIHRAAERNEIIWNKWDPVNCYPEKSYTQLISEMKTAFNEQLRWMDSEINGL